MKNLFHLVVFGLFITFALSGWADGNDSSAPGFSVKTGGELQTVGAAGTQKKNFMKDHPCFLTSGSITFNPEITLRNGITISGNVGIGADAGSAVQVSPGIQQAYLSFTGKFGEIQLGNQSSAADELSIDGTSVLGGQEGAAGSLGSVFNISGGALLQTGCGADDGIATKFIYMSPVFGGVQFGISYTPNSQALGGLQNVTNVNYQYHMAGYLMQGNLQNSIDLKSLEETAQGYTESGTKIKHNPTNPSAPPGPGQDLSNGAFYLDGITVALVYNYGSDDRFNCSFAACGWTGRGKAQVPISGLAVEDVMAYQVGFTLGYKGIKVAAGFTDNLKSLMNKGAENVDNAGVKEGIKKGANMGKVITAGLSFEKGPWKVAGGYYYSTRKYAEKDDETTGQVITATLDYKFIDGCAIFMEYDYVKTKGRSTPEKRQWCNSTNPFEDNSGNFGWIGTKISF
ncbi:MAG: porin [Holosporales bacterium]|jgi:hypothetical protein|nr:porin [Holosporales bacterium]